MSGASKGNGPQRYSKKPIISEDTFKELIVPEEDGSVCGLVESIVYRNDLNGYTVISLSTEGALITAVGILPDISEGDRISAWGNIETNPKYGIQYKITEYSVSVPTDASDLERYLASGAIRGIGPKTAAKIVEAFGEDTADVIDNHPEYLSQIPGITPKRAREISEEFRSKSDVRAVMTFFREYLGPSMTMKAYRHFGRNAIETAKNAPYRFCDEIDGIGFDTADAMARKLGLDMTSPERIASGIKYIAVCKSERDGNTCIPDDRLVRLAADELKVSPSDVNDVMEKLIKSGELVAEKTEQSGSPVRMIFRRETYDNEYYIANKIIRLNTGGIVLDFQNIRGLIRKSESEIGITYNEEQQKALISVLSRGVLVLTGGPGTGKTTVIRAMVGIFEGMGFKVALCAPTGRAAKRMTESTGVEAKTVHRLLEVNASEESDNAESGRLLVFRRDENNHLDEHVIILDEASMMDTDLMTALLKAVKPGSRLILIGDADQLPSVGSGNVLGDIINSGTVPVVTLTQIFRQAEMSLIVTNAHAINEGRMPDLGRTDGDFFFIRRDSDKAVAETVSDLCSRRLPAAYGYNEVIQVITPSRKGYSGSELLNSEIQGKINPPGKGKREFKHGPYTFRTGDRVMQIRNNYELDWESGAHHGQGIFNGDIGIITDIVLSAKYMEIDFDGRLVLYEFKDLDDIEPAYVITVHKSQGSEYSTVVLALGDIPTALRTRNLLYTAVTRAQRRVIVVGFESTIKQMVDNKIKQNRNTGLCRRLLTASGNKTF